MNYRLVANGTLREKFHRGSAPNLLAPPREDGPRPLRKRLSMEVLKGRTAELDPTKWPSLVTMCKWKQSLTERLLKRQRSSFSKVRVSRGALWAAAALTHKATRVTHSVMGVTCY